MIQGIVYTPTIIGIGLIGIFIFLKNTKARINQVFFGLSMSLLLWLVCSFIADTSGNASTALFWVRIGILWSCFMPLSFLWFSIIFPYSKKVSLIIRLLFCIPPILLIFSSFSPQMIGSVTPQPWGAEVSSSGYLYSIQLIYFLVYSVLGIGILTVKARKTERAQRSQIFLIIFGISFMLAVNIITNFILVQSGVTKYGILIGVPSLLVFAFSVAYAIIRHKLFDIRAAVARSVAFILSVVLIGVIYGFISFRLVAPFVQNISQGSRYAIFTIIAVIIAFSFQPIQRLFEKLSNSIFFRDRYDPQILLDTISHILASEIHLDMLDRKVSSELISQVKVSWARVIVLEQGKLYYQRGREILKSSLPVGRQAQDDMKGRGFDIKDLEHLGKSTIVADELSQVSQRKQVFDKYRMGMSLSLKTREGFVGFLLLGNKKSGDIFSMQDTKVLSTIASELAIAVQNSKSYEKIARFNITLTQKINQATKQLQSANARLKELDKAKDEFISMASHQLRTPLTTVKGYLSMLSEGDFGKLAKDQKDSIELALDGADRMAGLIGDLLNISRMEAGRFFIDARPLDLNAIVKSEVDQLQFRANSMGVKLSLKVGKIVPQISLDEDKTRQVIMNLVDNAIHYSPKGEVRVEFGLEGKEAVLKVIDNGIGVSEKDQKSLFSKFFRAGNAQKTRPDGTGLGLFLVKRVVEDQGGQIIFESEVGKGSTFGFRLPVR